MVGYWVREQVKTGKPLTESYYLWGLKPAYSAQSVRPSFDVTSTEVLFSEDVPGRYKLFRVFDFG
jgi:hypothetical protein